MNGPSEKNRFRTLALRRRFGKVQIPVALGMTLVWMLLFDGFQWRPETLGLLVLGFLVSVTIMLLFPLPPIQPGFRLWPLGTLRFLAYAAGQMVVASIQVTAQVFTPGTVKSSVISVRMRTDSDLLMVCTAIVTSVIPGSVIVEVSQEEKDLFVHFLGAASEAEAEEAKVEVRRLENRIVRAFGTREDIAQLDAALAGGKERV